MRIAQSGWLAMAEMHSLQLLTSTKWSPNKMPIASFSDPWNWFSCQTVAKSGRRKPWGNNTNAEDSDTAANCSKFQAHRRRLVCRCLPRGVASNSHGVRVKKCTCALQNWDRNVQQKNVHTAMFLLLTFAACYCFWPKHERSQIMCQLCGSGEDKRWKTTN